MRLHKIISAVSFAALLTVGGAISAQAKIFAPETDWIISSFNQAQTSSDPFCAMARRYTGDTIITIARNNLNETSVAVESGGLGLDTSSTYAVNLASGNDYLSSFDVKPVTDKAFVLKLGEDVQFFNAIKKNSYAALRVNSNDIELPLVGIDQGLNSLEKCIASLAPIAARAPQAEAAPVQEVAAAPMPTKTTRGAIPDFMAYDETKPAPKEIALPKPIAAKTQDTTPLPLTNSTLKARPSVSARELRKEEGTVKPQAVAERYVPKAMAPIAEEVTAVQAVAPRAPAYDSRSMMSTSNNVDELREENIRLSRALESERRQFENTTLASVDNNAVRELTDRLDTMSRENRILRGKVEAEENGREYLDLASALARMQTNEKNMMVQIEEQKKALASAQQEVASLRSRPAPQMNTAEVETLRQENARLRSTLNDIAQNKPQALTKASGVYTDNLNSLQTRLASLEAENRQLKAAQSSDPMSASAAEYELSRLKKRYTQAELENRRLGQLLKEARAGAVAIEPMPARALVEEPNSVVTTSNDTMVVETANAAPQGIRPPARFDTGEKTVSAPARETKMATAVQAEPITKVKATPIMPMTNKAVPSTDTQQQILALLREAQINGYSSMTQLASASKPGFNVYQWQDGRIFGTAEVTNAPSPQAFDTLMKAYIERTRQNCQGAFDAMPSDNGAAYDIACVDGPNGDAVASLYFLHKDGQFITIALETMADNFSQAMSVRDRIARNNS